MKESSLVRAFRPVTPESLHELEAFDAATTVFPRHIIWGRKVLGASVIESAESRKFTSTKHNPHPTQSLRSVFFPYPETATEPLTLEVKGIAFLGHHLWRRSLALILDDPAGIIVGEREEYLHRMQKTISKTIIPHVSVLDFEPTQATNEVIEWAQTVAPPSVTLGPVASYPALTPPPPKAVKQPTPKPQVVHSSASPLTNLDVRKVEDRPPIPPGLMRTLQHRSLPEAPALS